MGKYTPWPWGKSPKCFWDGEDDFLCMGNTPRLTTDQAEVIKRIILSSPDLVDACKYALRCFSALKKRGCGVDVKPIVDAIAKVEGRE